MGTDASAITYVDFKLTLLNEQSAAVEFDQDGKTREISGDIDCGRAQQWTVERLNYWVSFALKVQEEWDRAPSRTGSARPASPITVDDLKVIGLNLYRMVFIDDKICKAFNDTLKEFRARSKKDPNLRLRLSLVFAKDAELLSRLPWEFLFIEGESKPEEGWFFSGDRTDLILTRHVPPSDLVGELAEAPAERLRIMVAISTPDNEGDIKTDEVQTLITQLQTRHEVTVLESDACTTDGFETCLKEFHPHIVHFVGHGNQRGEIAFLKALTDDDYDERIGGKQARWVSGEQLRGIVANCRPPLRLMFLHACLGAAATSKDAFNSCARELVYAEVPAVVAMQYSISNRDATLFATKFYDSLAQGHDIDQAVKEGRMALGSLNPRWQHPRFGTPVVYLQTDKPLVKPVAQPSTTQGTAPTASRAGAVSPAAPATLLRPAAPGAPQAPAVTDGGDSSNFGT